MRKKALKITLIITACVLAATAVFVLFINVFMINSADDYFITPEEALEKDFDCILVLGSLVYSSGNLSPVLKNRVRMGVELFESGASDRLLMSGDHAQPDYDEVTAMKNYAIEAGIESACIFMDHAGLNTYDSMYRAKEIFQCKSILIVTQEFHMARSIYLARSLGLEAYGVCSDVYGSDEFSANTFYNNTREALARVKAVGYAIFKPEAKHLGDAIPISGNGDATND